MTVVTLHQPLIVAGVPVESLEVVKPEGISLTAPPSETIATLITCFPFNYDGPAPRRFVATARLNEDPLKKEGF